MPPRFTLRGTPALRSVVKLVEHFGEQADDLQQHTPGVARDSQCGHYALNAQTVHGSKPALSTHSALNAAW